MIFSTNHVDALQKEPILSILHRGMQVLLDKGDVFSTVRTEEQGTKMISPPTSEEFSELVHDYWFHVVWTTKKIKRGELWTGKSCCDIYMKRHA